MQKQDRLLYICFYILLNLAEDVSVERKMKKKVSSTFIQGQGVVQSIDCLGYLIALIQARHEYSFFPNLGMEVDVSISSYCCVRNQ